ncbi:glyceraldehyde-3-phosphate dehydrogenase 1, cytosolic-like [Hordeum vulgare subsp. vulgare]|uniref:glyceraldehyde-3-phosphate dehydrogenase 1, cytosolic-like n=1 Tax=Hordeum vulgare subsp. vulgare TaxID=112509 RepID=UPI001D1A565C|nr:glyceraldehyde-3-phosphate dehydrogenase 1, cytosolic-like [Hordeum vulgare subsp. vulgare]
MPLDAAFSAPETTGSGSGAPVGASSSTGPANSVAPHAASSSSALEPTACAALFAGSASSSAAALDSTTTCTAVFAGPTSSAATALESTTCTTLLAGSSATSTASSSLDSATSPGTVLATPNAALLRFIPPGSAFGDVLDPYAVCPADTVFPAVLSCPVAPSVQAQLPDKDAPVDTSPVYVKGDPFAKTMYQDSEVGPRKRSRDEEDIAPAAELNEVIKNVTETVFDEQHRSFEYMDRDWLTKGEYETLEFRSKAHPPQFKEVKKSKHGKLKLGPRPGKATKPRVGINGFGRTGRLVARLILHSKNMELVVVNDPFLSIDDITRSLEDMPPGLFPPTKVLDISEREKIPWGNLGADYIVESTGIFTDTDTASSHLMGGAKKVIICALSNEAPTFVYGVNENTYTPDIGIISIADTATICLALLTKILHTTFGIRECRVTITGSSCSAAEISRALSSAIPDLVGRFVVNVCSDPQVKLSCVEMAVRLDECADYEMIKDSVRKESSSEKLHCVLANLEGGVGLKATDYLGDCRSCFFDADAGGMLGDGSFQLFAWFNHQRSYGQRCTDMILHMAKKPRVD